MGVPAAFKGGGTIQEDETVVTVRRERRGWDEADRVRVGRDQP